jgi:hypothetical protein
MINKLSIVFVCLEFIAAALIVLRYADWGPGNSVEPFEPKDSAK